MGNLIAYYLCAAVSFLAYFAVTAYAISVYKNWWILVYVVVTLVLIGSFLTSMKPDVSLHIKDN